MLESIDRNAAGDRPEAGLPTFDQLRVFATVADRGSFSAAARCLNRTQSVVSYTIAALERQLGVPLFARGQRRPVLTEAGTSLLGDARHIISMVDDMRGRAGAMTRGLEGELALALDVMFPTERLVVVLEDFARAFPTVTLRLRAEALGGVAQLVMDGDCALGISGWIGTTLDILWQREIGETRLLAVAAPAHPLARESRPLTNAILREHTQLVLSDRSRLTEGKDFGVLSVRTWRLGDLGAKHTLLLAGLGWGNMPEPTVRNDLRDGRLVRLTLAETHHRTFPFTLIRRGDASPGPAARWLADRFGQGTTQVASPQPPA